MISVNNNISARIMLVWREIAHSLSHMRYAQRVQTTQNIRCIRENNIKTSNKRIICGSRQYRDSVYSIHTTNTDVNSDFLRLYFLILRVPNNMLKATFLFMVD
jgi:hypothetical protein